MALDRTVPAEFELPLDPNCQPHHEDGPVPGGAGGLLLSGDPREGSLLGDERAAPLQPGRGLLVRRRHPSTLVQVGVLDAVV